MAITAELSDGGNTRVVNMNDVDSDAVADGSVLVYRGSTSKWVAKNSLEADSGTITVSGGNF